MSKRICLWGKAAGFERALQVCRRAGGEILAVIDNKPSLWGTSHHGIEIVAPGRLGELNPDYIVIVSLTVDPICEQIGSLGFDLNKVLPFHRQFHGSMRQLGVEPELYYDCYSLSEECDLETRMASLPVQGKTEWDVPCPAPFEQQVAVAKNLLGAFLNARQSVGEVASQYQAGENWGGVLSASRGPLYDLAAAGDAVGLARALGNFCRNSLSESIMGGEPGFRNFLSATHVKWLQHNFEVWRALLDGNADLGEAAMPPIGNPYGYVVDGHIINWNSFPNHIRAYRCSKLLEGVERPVVAEIGGGFGGFAYNVLKRMPGVTYIDFDLPENLIIASYYLSMAYPEKRILLYDSSETVLDAELLGQYDAVMMPNFMLPNLKDRVVDFFINTISFSEMEYASIEEYFSQIDRVCGRWFYQENLSCHPNYKGYPTSVFPALRNFQEVMVTFSSWNGFDAYSKGHSYLERLSLRRAQGPCRAA
jgi:hypothetical protein